MRFVLSLPFKYIQNSLTYRFAESLSSYLRCLTTILWSFKIWRLIIFKSLLCSRVNTGCRYASLVQNFSVGSEEILNVPFFVWKPRQNITTVLTTEATLLEFMIQVILYRLVYGVQGCICNENIFYWFATHYTGQFATMNFAGQE